MREQPAHANFGNVAGIGDPGDEGHRQNLGRLGASIPATTESCLTKTEIKYFLGKNCLPYRPPPPTLRPLSDGWKPALRLFMFKNEKINLAIFCILIFLQLLGVAALWTEFRLFYLPIMIGLYFWLGLGTTLYLHRYLTHRGFEMPGWLKFFFATGSAIGLAGDPVTWVGDHRYHHLKSDTEEDIHSPRHGFPYAHMMWLIRKPPAFRERSLRYAADVRKIWYCKLWETSAIYVIPHLLVAATLFTFLGIGGLLWCLYVPILIAYNCTWAVNSICHMKRFGYRSFETSDESKNNFWIGIGALGEGYHNNHHAKPRCAAHGLKWWEIDFTRYCIWMLEKLHLAWNVVWPEPSAPMAEEEISPEEAGTMLIGQVDPNAV